MERPIDDILNDVPEQETVTEEATQEVVEQPTGPTRDEHGRFARKEETGVETPPQPEAVAEPVPPTEQPSQLPPQEFAALKDERRKRQEAERRIEAIEAQLRAQQQQQPAAP